MPWRLTADINKSFKGYLEELSLIVVALHKETKYLDQYEKNSFFC